MHADWKWNRRTAWLRWRRGDSITNTLWIAGVLCMKRLVMECAECGSIYLAEGFDGSPNGFGCWCCLLAGMEPEAK
jgi:hypothetical protein